MSSTTTRLTATRVATLRPGVYSDPGQVGLQLEVRPAHGKTSRTWNLRYAFRGHKSTMVLGRFPAVGLEQARKLAQHYRDLAEQGVDPRTAQPRRRRQRQTAQQPRRRGRPALGPPVVAGPLTPSDKHSVDSLCGEFLTKRVDRDRDHAKANSGQHARGIIRRDVLRQWSGRDARSITAAECRDLCEAVVARGSPAQANHTARLLKKLFRFAMSQEIVAASPAELLDNPGGRQRPRRRNLDPRELRALLRVPQAGLRTASFTHTVMLLLLTGQRRQELARSQWSWIDWDAKTWTFPDYVSKTRGHIVPLSDEALRHFRELHALARGSKWVLPKKSNRNEYKPPHELTRSMARCQPRLAKLGIAQCTLHDMRRTCRTGLARVGVLPHVAKLVLNHRRDELDETYDQWQYLDEKRDALNRWAAYLVEQREQALRDAPLVGRRTNCVTKQAPAPLITAALHYVLAHATESTPVRLGPIFGALDASGDLPAGPYETRRKKLQRALRELCNSGKLRATTAPRGYALPVALSKAA